MTSTQLSFWIATEKENCFKYLVTGCFNENENVNVAFAVNYLDQQKIANPRQRSIIYDKLSCHVGILTREWRRMHLTKPFNNFKSSLHFYHPIIRLLLLMLPNLNSFSRNSDLFDIRFLPRSCDKNCPCDSNPGWRER